MSMRASFSATCATRAPIMFSHPTTFRGLQAAGASQSMIDYMQQTEVRSARSYPTTTIITYAPYGPIGYYGPSATSYWGPRYYGAYDPFYGPPY